MKVLYVVIIIFLCMKDEIGKLNYNKIKNVMAKIIV